MQIPNQELSLDTRAYRFFPKKQQEKTSFDKKGTRFFFYGQIEHDDYQKKKMKQFYEYIQKKNIVYNKQLFNQQKLLLILQGNAYKPDKTLESMKNHQQFRKQYLPSVLTPQIEQVLKKGFFYPCGRDFNFRPILVFNAKLVDFKELDLNIRTTIHVHEQVIQKMFIPGQVQNWIIIYDLGGMGITQLPMNVLKTVVGTISSNYGGRLYKLFVLNAPSTIWFTWKLVSGFLDPVTVQKITISKSNTEKAIFKNCHPSQIEQIYGGQQPNRKQYYPFYIPQGQFDETRLITPEQYENKLKNKELSRNIIDPKYK